MTFGRQKRFTGLLAMLCLAGCATRHIPTDVETTGMPNAELALQHTIDQVNQDMAQIGTMGAGRPTPLNSASPSRGPSSVPDELNRPIQFVWTGSLDDGVRKLAESVGYVAEISKQPNAAPIAVSVNIVGTSLSAFRSLGDQAGTSASVILDPQHHQVKVIHHV